MNQQEIADILALLNKRDEQKRSLQFTEELLEKKKNWLVGILKPICLDGVKAYNADQKSPYKVLKDNFTISINLDEKTVSADIRLQDGREEVHGDFDLGDADRVAKALARFIDPLLHTKGTPFKFAKVSVPQSYYMD